MRFLLDESADARLITYLQSQGHDVAAIAVDHPKSLADEEVLSIAQREGRILITDDRDFGYLVFVQLQSHSGVIYLRIGPDVPLTTKIARLHSILINYREQLSQFVVVTMNDVRVRSSVTEEEFP